MGLLLSLGPAVDPSWQTSRHERRPLDRYGHLYGSDVEAVGVAINALLTRPFNVRLWSKCGQGGRYGVHTDRVKYHLSCAYNLWSLGESNP